MAQNLQQQSQTRLLIDGKEYHYHSLPTVAGQLGDVASLPKSLKILLENLLHFSDGDGVKLNDLQAIANWQGKGGKQEITFRPGRVLMQDFTGVPAIVDLAAMREAVQRLGGNTAKVNPLIPVDLIIDHSVMVDKFASPAAFEHNVQLEMQRNHERYQFLRWGQQAFKQFQVVPPGTGICHQVNLEYLGKVVYQQEKEGQLWLYPDTLVGTDSHTTMINGLGILGWGVGGIEAEAAMLGQPISMLLPEVVGFEISGQLKEGITATDLVLQVAQMLRKFGVVGKFVEFFGDGLANLTLADRATIANMSPEYGATCTYFPVDEETLRYLKLTGRTAEQVAIVEAYCKAQGMWRNAGERPRFSSTLKLKLDQVTVNLAGPKRPQDRVELNLVPKALALQLEQTGSTTKVDKHTEQLASNLQHGSVVIAAITSCTNTSNPSVMLAAGLVAKKALEKGLRRQPWVKSSLAPGSKVVTGYLQASQLLSALEQLGFYLVGYGCTTCIGNSGPLFAEVESAIKQDNLTVGAVLSGNRNFEGRIHPLVKSNWLASPPLVVAYAIAGSLTIDLTREPLGTGSDGQPVYLRDIWPTNQEIAQMMANVRQETFVQEYSCVFEGSKEWQSIQVTPSPTYTWQDQSTYIKNPPFFLTMDRNPAPVQDIVQARIVALLGDSVTTDHISPAGSIKEQSPAGNYLKAHGVARADFNSYGSRRGNHEVMMRGTFANIRLTNEMVPGTEGGITRHIPSGDHLSIYDAAMRYQQEGRVLAVIAGKEYGSGSSRDWAAKGPALLGIRVIIAESFERIHRSNLIGMGILPLEFPPNVNRKTLVLTGDEEITVTGLSQLQPGQSVPVTITYKDGKEARVTTHCRIDTAHELCYYQNGGILHYVIRHML